MGAACFILNSYTRSHHTSPEALISSRPLVQAADILIDEETEAEACAALAPLLETECDALLKNPHHQPFLPAQVQLLYLLPWLGRTRIRSRSSRAFLLQSEHDITVNLYVYAWPRVCSL